VVALATVVGLCFALAQGRPFGEGLLIRTAVATASGLAVATVAAAVVVKRAAGAVVSPVTLVRVLAALAAAVAVGRLLPAPGKIMTLAYAAIVVFTYLAILIATGEIGRADLAMVRRVLGRGRA
jgi:hypothetical protein